jgi:glycosyltransferase involved in cell wall biosynthesis
MTTQTIAILHYIGPPGIGGVEATIAAHARLLADDGFHVRVIAGSGSAPDPRIEMKVLPLLGSRHPRIEAVNAELYRGGCSATFEQLVSEIADVLADALDGCNVAMVHNVHTLHKNLPFTAALARLHQAGRTPRLLAWAHDFAWTDPLYASQLHAGWPWSLLREPWPNVQYVAVSHDRQQLLADLLQMPVDQIVLVPPGVDPAQLLKLEAETNRLIQEYRIIEVDPLLLLPARITRRKNIELAIQITAALRDEMRAPLLVVTGPPGPHNPGNAAYLAELQALRAQLDAPILFLYEVFQQEDGTPRPVSDAMIADWFSLADTLLFPSRIEGFGMPLIEAGLRGIPIFCSDIPPFAEIVDDKAIRFGLQEPPAVIARRIAETLKNDRRHLLRKHVQQHYTWQGVYQRAIKPLIMAAMTSNQ